MAAGTCFALLKSFACMETYQVNNTRTNRRTVIYICRCRNVAEDVFTVCQLKISIKVVMHVLLEIINQIIFF